MEEESKTNILQRKKPHAFTLYCLECSQKLANKAYESTLAVYINILTFSTKEICNNIAHVNIQEKSIFCLCLIVNNACKNCGLVVGFSVLQPCRSCLSKETNCHFTVFYDIAVKIGPYKSNFSENDDKKYVPDR